MSEPLTLLSGPQVRVLLVSEGFNPENIFISDGTYNLPTEQWVEHTFADWFEAHLKREGIVYTAEAFDCEDFSFESFAAVHRSNRVSQTGRQEGSTAGILWGCLWTIQPNHAINFSVHVKNQLAYVQEREPQPSLGDNGLVKVCFRPVTLTRQQRWEARPVLV